MLYLGINKYKLTKDDIKIIREDCKKHIEDNDEYRNFEDCWLECTIDDGSMVIDCHIWNQQEYDIASKNKVVISIYDTYINKDDHRVTDTKSDSIEIDLT